MAYTFSSICVSLNIFLFLILFQLLQGVEPYKTINQDIMDGTDPQSQSRITMKSMQDLAKVG